MIGNLWTTQHASTIDLERFRAHDQYLEQRPDFPYAAVVQYIRSRGLSHWLSLLGEDGAFGCVTSEVDGLMVSRDLLDSCIELDFLGKALGSDWLDARLVLDIGSGYGRFAHRYMRLHTGCVYCVDPVPISRVVCARYLHHRGLPSELAIAPEELGALPPVDLAVNIHSWSECTLAEVRFWLEWLRDDGVRHLMIKPHGTLSCVDGSYTQLLDAFGYQRMTMWSNYPPGGYGKDYYMFELERRGSRAAT